MRKSAIQVDNITLRFPRTKSGWRLIKHSLMGRLGPMSRDDRYFTALKDISFEIEEGEVIGIIGRNGAGKSCLLRVIAGIYRPDSGTSKASGKISLLAGLGLGFNPNLTGRENVYLYGSILGHSNRTMDELMDSIIEFSELHAFIDEPLRTYSSGMKARLGLSVASAVKPEILLIDEVLGVGDVEFKERSKERIQEMVRDAGAVVLVSHSFNLLKQICNRMIMLEKGRIKAIGEPEYVIDVYYGRTEVRSDQ